MASIPGELPAGGYNPSMYELLKTVNDPTDLRKLERKELHQLAEELRAFVLDSVSTTGGHLSSNLGTVELTLALHTVFETPEDEVDKTMEVAQSVMEKAPEPVLKLRVPLKVDARAGDNWEAAH